MAKLAWLNFTQKIDETIFNHGCCVSQDYCGARWMTLLPILAGIGGGLYSFFKVFGTFTNNGYLQLQYFVLIVWFLNQLLHIRHVFLLPGFWRKFIYPVFVTVVTVPMLLITMYLVILTLWAILIIVVLMALVVASVLYPEKRLFRRNWDGTYTEI